MQISAACLTDVFGRAVRYLSNPSGAAPPDDVAALLRTVEYDTDPRDADPAANRFALLSTAARFARVFQLGAPEAPGLIFLGAEMSPGLVAAGHAQAPLAGVGGMGLSMRAAFESCIGEGAELLSQLEDGNEPLTACSVCEMLDAAEGEARTYLTSLHPLGVPALHEPCQSTDPAGQIRWLAMRLAPHGIEPFVIDLTRPAFAVPAVRVIAPGLQIANLEGPRLRKAILATGGGQQATKGLPLF